MKKPSRKNQGIPVSLPKGLNERFIDDLLSSIPDEPRGAYLNSMVLSKYNGSADSSSLLRSRAISKWLETEQRNLRTNARLYTDQTRFKVNTPEGARSCTSDRVLAIARKYAKDILGPVTWNLGAFSGGASTSRTRRESHPAEKFAGKADITPGAAAAWAHTVFMVPKLQQLDPNQVEGNILFTVPKSSEIDRVACKEPDLNMFLQKGVGDYIRKRLRRAGVDLNDQTVNQRLAREGSVSGTLSTIDLSSASDSVTTQLACRLLDPDWFDLLMALRSPITFIDGEAHENQMLSSMGNGYTFEVESLFFYCLTRAVCYVLGCKGIVSVYGDDIICPTVAVPLLTNVLGFCGFIVNLRKSHFKGHFRESCGAHWYKGTCWKPFFIRRPVLTIPDLILHLNAVRRWWCTDGVWVDSDIYAFWRKYASFVPHFLWGGRDLDSNETLVSRSGKAKRLITVSSTKTTNHISGLLFWFHASERREGDYTFLIGSSRDVPGGKYVVRPSSRGQYNDSQPAHHVFAEEYVNFPTQ